MSSDPFGLVGTTIGGRYAVEALVGQGGSSVVYRARHTLWHRPVAIKALRGLQGADPETRERLVKGFVQEGAILTELSERTTAIVQARDAATLVTSSGEWVPYLVLEWLEGRTLETVLWQERCDGARPRTIHQAVALLSPIAQALALTHGQGICHRDLKPGNVFVVGEPPWHTLKLLDFGVATFFSGTRRALSERQRGVVPAGFTPSYAAPEQFSDAYGVTGPWTDVFALALVLVELVCGREALGDGSSEQLARIATDPARRPTPRALGVAVPEAVERVLQRALAVYPAERWQTAGSFWGALGDTLAGSRDREGAHGHLAPLPGERVESAGPQDRGDGAPEQDAAGDAAPARPSDGGVRPSPAAALALALAIAVSGVCDHPARDAAGSATPCAVVASASSR
jgi:serine/threonine protein kinase